ncbi:hypothetical protein HMPREF1544_06539 [Mucor circinelloides 1006PhL]|uniref:WIBG Mago-binding domain-containing protein n=1 Tax=Mucor circinelloides f. circinelloides (strain 1006PhL) TaxID=1220926 RepID=S2JAF0_MUCC1|nr:hypothetical protein HMPREF1544_06539 [Mucor circinelloides 1006PhL]
MTDPSNAGIIQVGEERWIPGSQRADGSYRKERKVRPGFVPLEDVKRYSNARIEASREASLPPGAKATTSSIPGAKKKPTEKPKLTKPTVAPTPPAADQTKDKKIKALNKKIRQISELEQKLIKGEKLNEEQHEKVKKGKSLREELEKLSLE